MRNRMTVPTIAAALGLLVFPAARAADLPQVRSAAEVGQQIVVEDLRVSEGQVFGRVVNRTALPIHDVQLRVLFSWRWKDEVHPGSDDPSGGTRDTLPGEIPPGGGVEFHYPIPTVAQSRTDGWYHIEVNVASYTATRRATVTSGESR